MRGRLKGHMVTKETREKLRLANLGKKYSNKINKKKGILNNKHMLGKKHTIATRKKMSKSHTGLKATKAQIKSLLGNKRRLGIYHTDTTKNKMRVSSKKGSENHNWKGGITPINRAIRTSTKYKDWRKSVFERDNYTCIWCGAKSSKGKKVILNADHIKPFSLFPELRFAIDNGRTLCTPCHKSTDTFAGKIRKLI